MNAIHLYQKEEIEYLYFEEKTKLFYDELAYNFQIDKYKDFFELSFDEIEIAFTEFYTENNIIFSELYSKYYEKEINNSNFQERILKIIEKL